MSLPPGIEFGKSKQDAPAHGVSQEQAFSQVAAPLGIPAPSSAAVAQAPTAPAAPSSIPAPPPAPPAPAPLSAPAAAAPTGTATPPPPVAGAETDKHGLPWDARIHAGGRKKITDGSWRQRRNLDAAVKTTVEAELRALLALNAAAAPVTAAAPAVPSQFTTVLVPPPPPAVTAPPAPPTAANPLGALLTKIAPHLASGKITPQHCEEVARKHGAQNLSQLAVTPNLVSLAEADFDALIGA